MSFRVEVSSRFAKQIKSLIKKFPSLKSEFKTLIFLLEEDPKQGSPLGNDCYKIRLAIKSKGKGKSGGARVITHLQIVNKTVYLLSIYNKSDKSSISDSELKELIKNL